MQHTEDRMFVFSDIHSSDKFDLDVEVDELFQV